VHLAGTSKPILEVEEKVPKDGKTKTSTKERDIYFLHRVKDYIIFKVSPREEMVLIQLHLNTM